MNATKKKKEVSNRIEIGDNVRVVWSGNSLIEGIVLCIPTSAGDCWIIETENAIHHVQTFETIWKHKVSQEIHE